MKEIMRFQNYINGKWVNSGSGETFEHRNPARISEVTGIFPLASADDTKHAIASAQLAFHKWKELTPLQRAGYLKRVLALMIERREPMAGILTLENGKILADSLTEVDSAISEMEFQIHQGIRLLGETIPSGRQGVFAYTVKEPLGVAGIITPWNFPVNVAIRKSIPALMAGNTVVFKPATLTPQTSVMLAQLFDEARLPEGVFNLVIGSGSGAGNTIVTDKRVKAISFTGSTEVGMAINRKAAENGTRTQLELGGKNPVVVLEDADLDLAVREIVRAAFSCSGQWCTSTSRVIVIKKIATTFKEKLVAATRSIIVGDGFDTDSGMGPVCGTVQVKTINRYIETGRNEGARIIAGGRMLEGERYSDGCYIEPTIFDSVTPAMDIAREEIFGPVLAVIEVDTVEEAIQVANDTIYGLSSSVFTNNLKNAMQFVNRSEVGFTHVNMMTAHKEPQMPFGGVKESGIGTPEAGAAGIEFFTRIKTIYINFA
jgi:alpha-ketoglutaric semialdehyde dehydrogenase